jgi:hypothetical protein
MGAKAQELIRIVENKIAATMQEYAMRELDMPLSLLI